jgi:hypothetical protein
MAIEVVLPRLNSYVLGLCCYIDFSKTYVKQAILSQKSSKNRAKSPKMHRLYYKTYASNKPQKYRGFTAKPMHNM